MQLKLIGLVALAAAGPAFTVAGPTSRTPSNVTQQDVIEALSMFAPHRLPNSVLIHQHVERSWSPKATGHKIKHKTKPDSMSADYHDKRSWKFKEAWNKITHKTESESPRFHHVEKRSWKFNEAFWKITHTLLKPFYGSKNTLSVNHHEKRESEFHQLGKRESKIHEYWIKFWHKIFHPFDGECWEWQHYPEPGKKYHCGGNDVGPGSKRGLSVDELKNAWSKITHKIMNPYGAKGDEKFLNNPCIRPNCWRTCCIHTGSHGGCVEFNKECNIITQECKDYFADPPVGDDVQPVWHEIPVKGSNPPWADYPGGEDGDDGDANDPPIRWEDLDTSSCFDPDHKGTHDDDPKTRFMMQDHGNVG